MTKKQPNVTCHLCGHRWHTRSKLINITCTNCSRKTPNTTIEVK